MSKFFERSLRVVEQFLQTAVVIDDRAFGSDRFEPEVVPSELIAPPTLATADTTEPLSSPNATVMARPEVPSREPQDPDPHGINARAVIDSFAKLGIVCSVLLREEDEDLTAAGDRARRLSNTADILIVDWQVNHKDKPGSYEETLDFLRFAVRESIQSKPQQLRLIVIYTGSFDLFDVANKVGESLESEVGRAPESDGELAFRVGATRIVVLGKPSNKRAAELRPHQLESDDDLARRTTREFAIMTSGLVSNVALESVTRVRRATHKILARFSPSVDAAFLSHRSLTDPPQEADEHLPPLIAAEFQAVIEEGEKRISSDELAEWLDERQQRFSTHEKWGFENAECEREFLLGLLERGHKNVVKGDVSARLDWLKTIATSNGSPELDCLVELIGGEAIQGANEELAMLMAVKSGYSGDPPHLTLGTVVLYEKDSAKSYWLCLQPCCDSVHVTRPRGYPMLKLSQSDQRFGLTVKVDDQYIKLRIDPRPFKVQTIVFKPDKATQAVIATKDDEGRFWFDSKEPTFRCRWIAELKFEQAQRAVNAFASQNSRVGLTESEWQRRWDGSG